MQLIRTGGARCPAANREPRFIQSQSADLLPPAGGALAEGFHDRLREFQLFERTFEVQEVDCEKRFSVKVNHMTVGDL